MGNEILLSNHSAKFLDNHHKGSLEHPEDLLGKSNGQSMDNLGKLIERGLVSSQEVTGIVKENYLPSLKAVSYSIDKRVEPPRLTLYTHAPVGTMTRSRMKPLICRICIIPAIIWESGS
ncbi:hypothetical protein [Legionella erythra]|uniref:hypothetical protein n=1 Tax=Legionella erythra TaxID=448 RepID=UPI0010417867|nr:hypothetical protein [Legionella erythra]